MTHNSVSNITIIGSDNGLSPDQRQAIIWTNAGILLIWPLGTNFSEIQIGIQTFSFKKIHLKMSSAKWRQFVSASMSQQALDDVMLTKPPLTIHIDCHCVSKKLSAYSCHTYNQYSTYLLNTTARPVYWRRYDIYIYIVREWESSIHSKFIEYIHDVGNIWYLTQRICLKTNKYVYRQRQGAVQINIHRCWNWHLCIPDGLSVVQCRLGHVIGVAFWRNLSGVKRTCWTTGSWRSFLSLEVVSSIPVGSTIIYRFLCGFICVFLCQSIKIKPTNMYVCLHACMHVCMFV